MACNYSKLLETSTDESVRLMAEEWYKARRGKIHRLNPKREHRLMCGRKLTWNYGHMYVKPKMNEKTASMYCKKCFAEENKINVMLTSHLPDELFEI